MKKKMFVHWNALKRESVATYKPVVSANDLNQYIQSHEAGPVLSRTDFLNFFKKRLTTRIFHLLSNSKTIIKIQCGLN